MYVDAYYKDELMLIKGHAKNNLIIPQGDVRFEDGEEVDIVVHSDKKSEWSSFHVFQKFRGMLSDKQEDPVDFQRRIRDDWE